MRSRSREREEGSKSEVLGFAYLEGGERRGRRRPAEGGVGAGGEERARAAGDPFGEHEAIRVWPFCLRSNSFLQRF